MTKLEAKTKDGEKNAKRRDRCENWIKSKKKKYKDMFSQNYVSREKGWIDGVVAYLHAILTMNAAFPGASWIRFRESGTFLSWLWNIVCKVWSFPSIPYLSIHETEEIRYVGTRDFTRHLSWMLGMRCVYTIYSSFWKYYTTCYELLVSRIFFPLENFRKSFYIYILTELLSFRFVSRESRQIEDPG